MFLNDNQVVVDFVSALLISGGHVALREDEEGVKRVTGIKDKTPDGAVRNPLLGKCGRTHMHINQLPHILHPGIKREVQTAENLLNHLGSRRRVALKGPAPFLVILLRGDLADIMQQRGPAKVQVVTLRRDVVKHLKGVLKDVLMPLVPGHPQRVDLREDIFKGTALLEGPDSAGGVLARQYLVQLLRYTLPREDFNLLFALLGRLERGDVVTELLTRTGQLALEAHHPQNTKRVLAEPLNGVPDTPDNAVFKVINPTDKVNQITEITLVDVDAHGVDGEVTTHDVVLEGPVKHERLPGTSLIHLFPRPDELHLLVPVFHHGRAKVLIHSEFAMG